MIPIHPLADIFPAIEGEAFEALKADIAANGLSVPITLWRGQIIDGRNRYRALVELGAVTGATAGDIDMRPWFVRTERVDGLDAKDLPGFVISRNLTRRHLSESQRAMVAARLSEMSAPGRPKRQDVVERQDVDGRDKPDHDAGQEMEKVQICTVSEPALSIDAAAKMLAVSPRGVKTARSLFRGPVELIEDVTAGRVAVSAAAKALREVMEGGGAAQDVDGRAKPDHDGEGGEAAQSQPAARSGLGRASPDGPSKPGVSGAEGMGPEKSVDEVYAQVKARLDAEKAAKLAAKKARREERVDALGERLSASNESLAALGEARRYGVILADPEWRFETWSLSGKDRSAENHYPCSALDEIKARPVSAIAAADCLLLLWATAPMLPQALEVMAAWGFDYRSHLIWCKDRIGTGYWVRNRHELLLIGVKGDIPAPAPGTQPPSVLDAPLGPHSAKPPFAHEFAELCWPGLPKIELNARAAREGWDAWGAEAPPHPAAAPPPSPARGEGEEGAAEDDAGHPLYGRDYNKHGVLRIPPAETLAMPPVKGAKHVNACIDLHPWRDVWLWSVNWSSTNGGGGSGISPKWRQHAPTRDAALKAAIGEIAGRLGKSHCVTAAADRAIMTWLEGLARQAGADGALPARAAAKGRLSRRRGAPGDGPAGKTQPEQQGEPA
jgi:N6-adenosine-specific RNA methylase IME4